MNTQPKIIPIDFKALTIGNKVLKIVEDSGNALCVEGVFDHAFYLRTRSGGLLKIVRDEDFLSPASILVNGDKETGFRSSGISGVKPAG